MFKSFTSISIILITALNLFSQNNIDTLKFKKKWSETSWGVIKKSVLTVPSDFKEMGLILSEDWKKTSLVAGGITTLVLVDKYTTSFYQDKIEKNIVYSLPNISPKIKNSQGKYIWPFQENDTYIIYPIIGLYAGSLISNYETGQRASANTVKALAYSMVVTQLTLKTIAARLRPDTVLSDAIPPGYPYTTNPFDFGFFHRPYWNPNSYGTSFPSLHTTAYAAAAQVMAMEFNNYWIPYSFVTFIFLADIKGHHHWISDMVAGGVVGALIGTAVVKSSRKFDEKRKKKFEGLPSSSKINFKLIPDLSKNFTGLHLLATF